MFVLYAFSPCKSQSSQTLHGTPLGQGEGQDGVDRTERGGGWNPSSFQKRVENFRIFKKCRKCSQISEVLASCFYIFALPLVKGYLSIQNFLRPGYLETPLLERYSKCPIQKIRTGGWFLNNLRTKGDKDLRFSPLDTRDSGV